MKISIQQSNIQKFFDSKPYVIDNYFCETDKDIEKIKVFVKDKIYSKQELDLNDFHLQDKSNEYFTYKRNKTIRVGFEYFWNEYLEDNERKLIYHLLSLIDGSIYENNLNQCDIIYHSYFGNPFQNYFPNKKYIFFSGEKYPFPIEKYKTSLSFYPDSSLTVCYPFFFTMIHAYQPYYDSIFVKNQTTFIPKEFCAFIVSNPNCQIRNNFFQSLSQYKKVSSYGKVMNNVGYLLDYPYNDKRQLDILGKHKFVICFENMKTDNYYITEKLLIAKASGSIPIYYGSEKCLELFDKNSFLYLENESQKSIQNLLSKIILLDQNDTLYLNMRNKELLKPETKQIYSKNILKQKIQERL
jgi:hypothetical protein